MAEFSMLYVWSLHSRFGSSVCYIWCTLFFSLLPCCCCCCLFIYLIFLFRFFFMYNFFCAHSQIHSSLRKTCMSHTTLLLFFFCFSFACCESKKVHQQYCTKENDEEKKHSTIEENIWLEKLVGDESIMRFTLLEGNKKPMFKTNGWNKWPTKHQGTE